MIEILNEIKEIKSQLSKATSSSEILVLETIELPRLYKALGQIIAESL